MRRAFILRRNPRVSRREIVQFAEAATALIVAWAATKILPFRIVMRTTEVCRAEVNRSAADTSAVGREVGRAVKRAARRLPWTIVCFPEGLAAHWMLRRRGAPSQVHYGLRPSQAKLSAHVWVTLAGEIIVGEEQDDPHTCVAVFPQASSN